MENTTKTELEQEKYRNGIKRFRCTKKKNSSDLEQPKM